MTGQKRIFCDFHGRVRDTGVYYAHPDPDAPVEVDDDVVLFDGEGLEMPGRVVLVSLHRLAVDTSALPELSLAGNASASTDTIEAPLCVRSLVSIGTGGP